MKRGMHQFGLAGQQETAYYNFLGLGKKAKAKKKENRAIRVEKRQLKNEERKAGVERMRAENQLLNQMLGGPSNAQAMGEPSKEIHQMPDGGPENRNTDSTTTLIVIIAAGVVVTGVAFWLIASRASGTKSVTA